MAIHYATPNFNPEYIQFPMARSQQLIDFSAEPFQKVLTEFGMTNCWSFRYDSVGD